MQAIADEYLASPTVERTQAIGPPTPGASGTVLGNMDLINLGAFNGAEIVFADASRLSLQMPSGTLSVAGAGLVYDQNSQLVNGVATGLTITLNGPTGTLLSANVSLPSIGASPFGAWVYNGATSEALESIFSGSDTLGGSALAPVDLIRGFGGDDVIYGVGGADTIFGGAGNDSIYAIYRPGLSGAQGVGGTYLRGDEGDDLILGGPSFDDINGNMGNDTANGGDGDDWVVGGKDNDYLKGEHGNDVVLGNLGNDTQEGGAGNDIVRGGQDNDSISGGSGDDYVSGDKGDDTVVGGEGADQFHTFGEAGLDRVLDFNRAQGDIVRVDPGTTYAFAQSGADVDISMSGGGHMILVGVQISSLTSGWIFVG